MDSSVFVKLAQPEPESPAVRLALARHSIVSSRLLVTESRRAILRQGNTDRMSTIDNALEGVAFFEVNASILEAASRVTDPGLRTLDAIHLVTALRVPDLDVFICHDVRLTQAAAAAGLRVLDPR